MATKGQRLMNAPWEVDFFPAPMWQLMTNLGLLVAIVAVISAVVYLYKHGPALLIKYGFAWMTRLGVWWGGKRS